MEEYFNALGKRQLNLAMTDSTQSASKTYKKKMPILWWTKRTSHLLFITRELTSLAVAYFAIILLFLIRALSQGQEAYNEFIALLKSPTVMLLSMIALCGLIFHSVTWFNLAPKAMVIKVGKRRVPAVLIVLANYAGWLVISVVIGWFLLSI